MNEFNRSCSKISPGATKSIDFGVRKRIFVWRKFNSAFGFYLLFHFGINQLLLIIAAFLGISTILNNQLNFNLYSLRQFSFVFQSMGTGKEIEWRIKQIFDVFSFLAVNIHSTIKIVTNGYNSLQGVISALKEQILSPSCSEIEREKLKCLMDDIRWEPNLSAMGYFEISRGTLVSMISIRDYHL